MLRNILCFFFGSVKRVRNTFIGVAILSSIIWVQTGGFRTWWNQMAGAWNAGAGENLFTLLILLIGALWLLGRVKRSGKKGG